MSVVEKVVLTMLSLVALYLVLANSSDFDTILKSLTSMQVGVLGTLQGRNVTGAGVTVGGNANSRGAGGVSAFSGFGMPQF